MFEVNYTLATLNEDMSTQMTSQNSSQQSIIIKNNTILEAAGRKDANNSIIASRANTNSQNSQNSSTKTDGNTQKNNK